MTDYEMAFNKGCHNMNISLTTYLLQILLNIHFKYHQTGLKSSTPCEVLLNTIFNSNFPVKIYFI